MSSRVDTRVNGRSLTVSLYVHVPFCVVKCAYCDFHSTPISPEPALADHFAWAVGEGAAHWAALGVLDDVASIYVGGGTPTTLGSATVSPVDVLHRNARLAPDAEVTVETNPDTTDPAIALQLVEVGVTRFSLGVQSFDDTVLRTLGRCHTASSAERALEDLLGTGAAVSMDLICGVPGQTRDSWRDTVRRAVSSGVGHISVYPLTVEEGTPFAESVSSEAIEPPDDDLAAEMMESAGAELVASGFRRYEVASYARDGCEGRHNAGYWTGRPYIGIGPAAASMLPAEVFGAAIECEAWSDPGVAGIGRTLEGVPPECRRVRMVNPADTITFLRKPVGPPEDVEYLTGVEAAAEDAMLGLRLTDGITDGTASDAGVADVLTELASQGLVEHVGDRWRVTSRGWLLGNEVFESVWYAGTHRGMGWHSL